MMSIHSNLSNIFLLTVQLTIKPEILVRQQSSPVTYCLLITYYYYLFTLSYLVSSTSHNTNCVLPFSCPSLVNAKTSKLK